tara:strand:+ start:332 stop:1009 length:678 start_codon:yes stop_codon:yes gene_type:complete
MIKKIINTNSHNIREYDKKFLKQGYGIKYPEGHVIRNSKHFRNKESILDFGCGNGTHLKYFKELNIKKIYGVDTSKVIKDIKKNQFRLFQINERDDLIKIIKIKFDVIFVNQVFYYMNNETIDYYLNQFSKMLKKDGIMFTTWMAPKTSYYKLSKKIKNSEMRKLVFGSRLKETTYINFKTKADIKKQFHKHNFETINFGHYDSQMNHDEIDSGSYHYLHLCKKK